MVTSVKSTEVLLGGNNQKTPCRGRKMDTGQCKSAGEVLDTVEGTDEELLSQTVIQWWVKVIWGQDAHMNKKIEE